MLIVKSTDKILFTATATILALATIIVWLLLSNTVLAAERSILFPILGGGRYTNDFNAPRSGGPHFATDIFAEKHRPLVAAVDGTITYVGYPQPNWGYMIQITDTEGYKYNYLHINNDNRGTDDGQGGAMNAYAADMKRGNKVTRGQLLGWVGDSGNAETTPPHLHFEIVRPDGSLVDPYTVLIGSPIKRDLNPYEYIQLANETIPYGPYNPQLNIAIGNFDSDPEVEVATSPGAGSGAHVKLYERNMTFSGQEFFAYTDQFRGGADIAAGDVDGDGVDEIITGAGPGGGPHVQAFKPSGQLVASFYAYGTTFSGGVSVAAGDVDGDGVDEIITGPASGGGPHVRIFKINGQELAGFYAYSPEFRGGVDVAVGDLSGDGKNEIITGAGPGGGPHVQASSYSSGGITPVTSFYAYESQFTGGVKISAGNVRSNINGVKQEILVAPRINGGPHIRMFNGSTGTLVDARMFMEEWWIGYYDIAAGEGFSLAATGVNRRASVRTAF